MRNGTYLAAAVVIVCACGCKAPPEEQALELVAAYGGTVRTDPAGRVLAVDLSNTAAGDDVIAALAHFPTIKTLNCSSAGRITGHGFASWSPESQLEELYLVGTAFDDGGLHQLQRLRNLKTLQLGQTKVTNAGLRALDHLTNLETLSLSNTAITDTGLIELRDLRHLSTLILRETGTTPRGIVELRRMLPDARIVN